MSQTPSYALRRKQDAAIDDDPLIVLFEFTHADLEEPIRLSSDQTEVISSDPRIYGTRSTWRGTDPETEYFRAVACSIQMPGDQADAPAAAQVGFDLFDASLPTLLRSFSTRAACNVALVLASDPNTVERQWLGMEIMDSDISETVSISASRKPIEEESAPMELMNKQRFPGLFR